MERGITENNPQAQFYTHNMEAGTLEDYNRQFIQNQALRTREHSRMVYMYHTIISFSDREDPEQFTDEVLWDITRKYISLRGDRGIYVVAIHHTKNIHLHIAESGCEYRTGKAFRLSKTRMREIKQELQSYHLARYQGIVHSTVNHGSGVRYNEREWQAERRNKYSLAKTKVRDIVKSCLEHAHSQNDLMQLLQAQHLHFYERDGKPVGILNGDTKLRFKSLGISQEQFDNLPLDRTEEEKALAQIRDIRSRNQLKNKQIVMDR